MRNAVAQNPDPTLKITSLKGVTRTLDDWTTMFHVCLVVLPDRPEGAAWVPVARRIFHVLGDADCRAAVCVAGSEYIARRVVGTGADEFIVFTDPDKAFARSLGLTQLPAFVHLQQDTTLVDAAEGWNPREWQRVADGIAKAMKWSSPQVARAGDPAPTQGWPI
jgi:hypothetical protein